LRFLPVRAGIVILNKIDLVEDPSWLGLVKDDVKALVAGTFLQGAPAVEFSAKTGQGIPELVKLMDQMLDQIPARQVDAPVRLPGSNRAISWTSGSACWLMLPPSRTSYASDCISDPTRLSDA